VKEITPEVSVEKERRLKKKKRRRLRKSLGIRGSRRRMKE